MKAVRASSLAEALRQVVGKANVLDSGVDLRLYGYDAYLEERRPDAVVFVHSTDEVSQVVKTCNDRGVPFVARGGGTNLSGGTVAVKGGVVIEMIRMNKILEIDQSQPARASATRHVQSRVRQRPDPAWLSVPA